jgi:hypothetical protein
MTMDSKSKFLAVNYLAQFYRKFTVVWLSRSFALPDWAHAGENESPTE